jgi:hypothetical protein
VCWRRAQAQAQRDPPWPQPKPGSLWLLLLPRPSLVAVVLPLCARLLSQQTTLLSQRRRLSSGLVT